MQDGGSGVVDKEENLMRKVFYLQRSESLLPSKGSPRLLPQHTHTAPLPSKRKFKSFSWSPPPISLQGCTQEVSFFFAIANGNSGLIDFRLFFFFPFPAFRNTFFLKCSSDLQLPHTKAVNGFRLRHLHYLYLQRRRMNPEALAIMQTCSQSHCVSRCSLPQAVTNHVDGKP